MNAQKYTQKSLEAVQNAQSIATEYGNQQIEQPHLLLALLLDEGGLIPQLLGNMASPSPPSPPPPRRRWKSCPGCPAPAGSRARSMWPRTWTSASTPPRASPRP